MSAYAFDEGSGTTTADASGNGNTGQINGATWTTNGHYGNALSFDGASSYVDLGSPAVLQNTGTMSWSAWVYLTALSANDGQIISQSNDSAGWEFKVTSDTGPYTFGVAVWSGAANVRVQRYSNTNPVLNTWYHLAGVYNAATQTLDIYVNGVLDDGVLSGTVPTSQVLAPVDTVIGRRFSNYGGYYFNGIIDNARIYTRALSASDVQVDMATPVGASSTTAPPPVTSPVVSSLQCTPGSLSSGASSTCTVTLSQAAPSAGSTVTLSSSATALTVPASVSVAAAATTATFTATAGTISSAQTATVTAKLGSSSATSSIGLAVTNTVSSVACNPTSLASGSSSTCTVTLSQPAPSAGASVTLSSSATALTVPASVSVAAAATTATFTATAGTISSAQTATVTAKLGTSSVTSSIGLAVTITVSSVACNPTSLASGASSTCTVTLSQAATSGGASVTLSSSNTSLTVPASVSVAAAATTATFTATAGTISSAQTATVTAKLGSSSATASISLTAPVSVSVSSVACNPTSLAAGASSTCTVTLSQAAPSAGATVTLSSSNTTLTVPASVSVAAKSTTATFTATAASTATLLAASSTVRGQSATLTASLNGSSATATISIQSSAPSPTTLDAAYGFSEGTGSTTADVSGNGNTGKIYYADWTSKGKYGEAISFNGRSSYVDLGTPSSLKGTGSMSWSAWVYLSGYPSADGQIVSQSNDSAGWQLKLTADTGSWTFAAAVWSGATNGRVQRYSKTVPANKTWYNVAGVYNATSQTLDIYVNGVLDDGVLSGAVPTSQVLAPVDAAIGRRFSNYGGYYFNGVIDEVRIYTGALSQAQIQSNMTTPLSSTAPPSALTTNIAAVPHNTAGATSLGTRSSSNMETAAQERNIVSGLSCSPRAVVAGNPVTCTLRLAASTNALPVQLQSSSPLVKVPAVVTSRPNQSSLTFQASVDAAAGQQSATVSALAGGSQVEDTILVNSAERPVMKVPGKQLARFGATLSFNISAVDPSGLPVQLAATNLPAGAYFDAASARFEWAPNPTQGGSYTVTFTATNGAGQTSTATVPIAAGSGAPVLDSSKPFVCSPGALTSLDGSWLAAPGTAASDPSGNSTDLSGTKVKINGQYASVTFASPLRIAFVCPNLNPGTQASLAIETADGASAPATMTTSEASPKIFSLDSIEQGVISFTDTTELAMPRNHSVSAHPAQPGDRIVVWATGLGSPAGTVSLQFAGVAAEALSVNAVSGYAGVYTVEFEVPASAPSGDAVPVQLHVSTPHGGPFTSNNVTMAVEPANQ